MIHLDTALLAFIAGTVIPLATGLLTKLHAPSGLKAFVSAVLSGVTAVVALLTSYAGVVDAKQALFVFFGAWVTQAGTYWGFFKPTGVTQAVQDSTAGVGLG